MALKAGRVGVAPDQVDNRGKVTGAGFTPEQQAKLDRALLTPVQAPAEDKIVGVSTGRTQLMLGIGAGLALKGGQLIGTEVPEYTVSEAGKVLKVNSSGELEWSDPPQGGGDILNLLDECVKIAGYTMSAQRKLVASSTTDFYYMDISEFSKLLISNATSTSSFSVNIMNLLPTEETAATVVSTVSVSNYQNISTNSGKYIGFNSPNTTTGILFMKGM